MERYAKKFRSYGSFFILLNLIAFFLPITRRIQEGYITLQWSQFDYIKNLVVGSLPHTGESLISLTSTQILLLIFCVMLPLVMALIAGIWGITGNSRQKISSILILGVFLLYIVLFFSLDRLWPRARVTQVYEMGNGIRVNLIVSSCAALWAVFSFLSTPKKMKKQGKTIPRVKEIKHQQAEAKYNIIMQEANQAQNVLEKAQTESISNPNIQREGKGMMVGLNGIYAGAQIPMPSGEYIKLGRSNTNHLIFDGQSRVSREHCKIKWDAAVKKYMICDYSNTGCFVDGSHECLPQNLELFLEPGTVVAIGDETNTLRLE